MGFFVLLALTAFCYAFGVEGLKDRVKVFFKSILVFIIFFGVLAYLNEHYTKPVLRSQRPSHVYMLKQTGLGNVIDSLYQLDKQARKQFFEVLVKTHPAEFREIDQDVTAHWIEEAGYSFPSGHTFNAFLFAMILAYAIFYNRRWPKGRKLFVIPFIWALLVGLSRVALGAHTAFDVTAGAVLGIALGFLFLYGDRTRHWLTRKQ